MPSDRVGDEKSIGEIEDHPPVTPTGRQISPVKTPLPCPATVGKRVTTRKKDLPFGLLCWYCNNQARSIPQNTTPASIVRSGGREKGRESRVREPGVIG